MKSLLRGRAGSLMVFAGIAVLVAGGLGWVTAAALRLEREQFEARVQAERYEKLRLALWKLDSRISPILAREDSRPYNHYSGVFAPSPVLRSNGQPFEAGTVLEPSPLLNAELPDWILLHFQTDEESGWESPQVLSASLARHLAPAKLRFVNATPRRAQLLTELSRRFPSKTLVAAVQQRGLLLTQEEVALVPAGPGGDDKALAQTPQGFGDGGDYLSRRSQQNAVMNEARQGQAQQDDPAVIFGNFKSNGGDWFSRNVVRPARSEQVAVSLSPLVPLWLRGADGREQLVAARLVHVGKKEVCQGLVLDWPRLQTLLTAEADPPFPQARVEPVFAEVPPYPERTMTALPVQLDPGPEETIPPLVGWTTLRVGLASAWAAALVALLAVGLGGWSLLSLSERRIRFVSAVTHELRTPLTTLRLYLDMLATGLVKEDWQKAEYLHTLNAEADRLNRLVANVLHFSRLENQRPRLDRLPLAPADLLEQLRTTWQGRCQDVGKELIVENNAPAGVQLITDGELVQQVLGNLIDNACKYSRGAEDRRLWLRALRPGPGRLALEVEDRGPGVPARERRLIFRPFRRGRGADVTAGGVGLGLALARRWAKLLGGILTLRSGPDGSGACFRLEFTTKDTK